MYLMDWEYIISIVVDSVFKAALIAAIAYVSAWAKSRIKNELVQGLIDKAEKSVNDCVISVNQTIVEGLKKEGKFDAAAQELAFEKCKTDVLAILSKDAKEAVISTAGDLEGWLKIMIEKYVNYNKPGGAAIAAA